MRCAEIQANLVAFVLGGLEPEEAAEVKGHLASCPSC
jgi:anti-sigma factor RsiW